MNIFKSIFKAKSPQNNNGFTRKFTSKSMEIISNDGKYNATLDLIANNEIGEFYIFRSPLDMPYLRQHLFDKIEQSKSLGYTKTDIEEILTQIQQISKTPTPSMPQEVYRHATNLVEKLKDAWTFSEASLMLATLMIVEKDEEILNITDEICTSKLSKWKANPTMLAFFFENSASKYDECSKLIKLQYRELFESTREPGAEPKPINSIRDSHRIIVDNTNKLDLMIRAVTNNNILEKKALMRLSVSDVYRELQLFIIDANEQRKAFDKLNKK
jgi:hypothetical protein